MEDRVTRLEDYDDELTTKIIELLTGYGAKQQVASLTLGLAAFITNPGVHVREAFGGEVERRQLVLKQLDEMTERCRTVPGYVPEQ